MASGVGFKVPNETGNALASTRQAEIDEKDFEVIRDGFVQDGVYSGCAVTAKTPTPDMSVDVAAGVVIYHGAAITVTGGNIAIPASEASPRFDLVCINDSGSLVVIQGADVTDPVFPAYPANRVVLAAVFVGAADTDVDADQIVDKRVFIRSLNISGTIGARPPAAIYGRYYFATDKQKLFFDTGTVWELIGPTNVFDTFNRANGALGTSDSGHAWTTDGLQITSNEVRFLSGSGQGRINLGHPIDRATFKASVLTGTGSVLDAAIIVRWLDATHYLYVQLLESDSLRIVRVNGTHILQTSVGCSILDNHVIGLWVELDGSFMDVKAYDGNDLIAHIMFGDKIDFYDPFTTATTCGIRLLQPSNGAIRDFVANVDR